MLLGKTKLAHWAFQKNKKPFVGRAYFKFFLKLILYHLSKLNFVSGLNSKIIHSLQKYCYRLWRGIKQIEIVVKIHNNFYEEYEKQLAFPSYSKTQKPGTVRVFRFCLWRWRESNPRPESFTKSVYILSASIGFREVDCRCTGATSLSKVKFSQSILSKNALLSCLGDVFGKFGRKN